MTFKNASSFFLAIISAFCAYYIFIHFDWQKDHQIEPDAEKPLFTSKDIETTSYNIDGIRNYALKSKQLEHYKSVDETHFEQPLLLTYKEGIDNEWRASANSAILKGKHILVMSGDVNIHNLLPESQLRTITADKATLNLTTGDFWTESKTQISGISFETHGNRAKGNFDSHTAELIEKVKTVYEPKIN